MGIGISSTTTGSTACTEILSLLFLSGGSGRHTLEATVGTKPGTEVREQSLNEIGRQPLSDLHGTNDAGKARRTIWIVWGAIACFFILFSYCIPITCDDWYAFVRLQQVQAESKGLFQLVSDTWRSNSRLLFLIISNYVVPNRPLLMLVRVLTLIAIAIGMERLTALSRRGGSGVCLVFLFMMLLPIELLRQTYSWHIAFLNYVLPVALLLLYLCCIYPLFSGRRIKDSVWLAVLCLLLGVCVQLFSQPITVYVTVMSVGVVVWHAVRTKKVSVVTVFFAVGAIAGAIIMFTSPPMHNLMQNDSAYYTAPTSLGMVLYILKHNYPIFSYYSLGNSALLQITISVCALVLLWRGGASSADDAPWRTRLKKILSVLLIALPVYFRLMSGSFDPITQSASSFHALTQFFGSVYCSIAFDALLYFLYVANVACVLIFFTKDTLRRNLGLFSMASAIFVGAPMLVVQPIPYRCFLLPYVLWTIVALLFVDGVWDGIPAESRFLRSVCIPGLYAAAAVTCAFYLMLYARCPKIERARVAYIEQEMALGAKEIVLPQYACAEYLHLPDDAVEMYYHYETANDVQFRYIPYDQWKDEIAAKLPQA